MHALLRQLPPQPHTPIHKGIQNSGAGAEGARPTVVDSFMDGCVGAGEAANAAKHA